MTIDDRVALCIKTRQVASRQIERALKNINEESESDLRDKLQKFLASQKDILSEGWYSPPPAGIGVLFGTSTAPGRTRFPSFRQETYWPGPDYIYSSETVATIYVSPVHESGTIGDLGFSFYQGHNKKVQRHLKNCLEAIEDVATQASVGMQFRDVYQCAQKLFGQRNLTHKWITTNLNISGNSIGHTVPWSYELLSALEEKIINQGEISKIKEAISHKRLYLDADETFVIPKTAAFTVESQLGSSLDENLPNTFFHTIVTFKEGKKKVLSNFNRIFDTLGIDYMRSRF
jgi:hypothetical protein